MKLSESDYEKGTIFVPKKYYVYRPYLILEIKKNNSV